MAWSDEARAAALAARQAHAKSSGTASKGSKSSTHALMKSDRPYTDRERQWLMGRTYTRNTAEEAAATARLRAMFSKK